MGVLTHGYKLEQSTEQETVVALESLMNGQDSVTFDHCSMFIDSVRPCGYDDPRLCGGGLDGVFFFFLDCYLNWSDCNT